MHHSRPHHRSRHDRSQRSNADEGGSSDTRRRRRQRDGYDDRGRAIDNEQLLDRTFVDDQSTGWHNAEWAGDTSAFPNFSNSGFGPLVASGQTTMSNDSMLDRSPYYHAAPENTAWSGLMTAYEPSSPHTDLHQFESPTTSSPIDVVPSAFPGTSSGDTASGPLFGYQSGPNGTSSAHYSWELGMVAAPERTFRRSSTRARQGSATSPNVDGHGDMDMPDPGLQTNGMEGHDYSDSSGDITPVELGRYVLRNDDPWSPEFPHQNVGYQYPD